MKVELAAFLDVACAHRMRANEIRRLSRDATNADSRRQFETLAIKLEIQASRLEEHAIKIQLLMEKTRQSTDELRTELEDARNTIAEIRKALLPR